MPRTKDAAGLFDKILDGLMEPFETETILPRCRKAAGAIRPFLVETKDQIDSVLADRDFLHFGGELSPEEQRQAATLIRKRYPMGDLIRDARSGSVWPGEVISSLYVGMQAGAVARYGKAWTSYLSQRQYLDLEGGYRSGIEKIRPLLSDRDRQWAAKAIDPKRGLSSMEMVAHSLKAFVEWGPTLMQFEMRQHATIPQIRKRIAVVVDRKIDEAVSQLAISIHETVWEVINKTFSELQENIYFIAEGE